MVLIHESNPRKWSNPVSQCHIQQCCFQKKITRSRVVEKYSVYSLIYLSLLWGCWYRLQGIGGSLQSGGTYGVGVERGLVSGRLSLARGSVTKFGMSVTRVLLSSQIRRMPLYFVPVWSTFSPHLLLIVYGLYLYLLPIIKLLQLQLREYLLALLATRTLLLIGHYLDADNIRVTIILHLALVRTHHCCGGEPDCTDIHILW